MTFLSVKIKQFFLLAGLLIGAGLPLFGQEFPEPMTPPRIVNDYVDLLSQQQFNMLESKLRKYRDTTSNEFAVVIVETIGQDDIDLYGAELAQKWGIGAKGKENGLLILVAVADRKISIKTGYGLEGAIPDAYAKRVIEKYVKPNFRQEKYFEGLDQATSILMGMASGEFKGDPTQKKALPGALSLIVIFFLIIVPILSVFRGRKGHLASKPAGFWSMLFLASQMGRGRGNTFNDFNSGGGSFGGFGGGSFGGGGASGSW